MTEEHARLSPPHFFSALTPSFTPSLPPSLTHTSSTCHQPESEATALIIAAQHGHYEMVKYLLKLGADVNKVSSSG